MYIINKSLYSPYEDKRNQWIKKGMSLGLSYCSCSRYPLSRRAQCEQQITRLAYQAIIENSPLKVMSIGSGLGLQDFLVLKRLLKISDQIEFVQIDPLFENDQSQASIALTQIKDWVARHNGKKQKLAIKHVSVESLASFIAQYAQAKFHLIYLMDFDALESNWELIFKARHILTDKGQLFLASQSKTIIMDKKDFELFDQDSPSQEIQQLVNAYQLNNSQALPLPFYVGISLADMSFFKRAFVFIPALIAKGVQQFTIDCALDDTKLKEGEKFIESLRNVCAELLKDCLHVQIDIKGVKQLANNKYDLLYAANDEVMDMPLIETQFFSKAKSDGFIFFDFSPSLNNDTIVELRRSLSETYLVECQIRDEMIEKITNEFLGKKRLFSMKDKQADLTLSSSLPTWNEFKAKKQGLSSNKKKTYNEMRVILNTEWYREGLSSKPRPADLD